MTDVIRLQYLPRAASAVDVRQFFHGLSIPERGVRIIGGKNDEAFIVFSTIADAANAVSLNGKSLKGGKVTLLPSSRAEMKEHIESFVLQKISKLSTSKPKVMRKLETLGFDTGSMKNGVSRTVTKTVASCYSLNRDTRNYVKHNTCTQMPQKQNTSSDALAKYPRNSQENSKLQVIDKNRHKGQDKTIVSAHKGDSCNTTSMYVGRPDAFESEIALPKNTSELSSSSSSSSSLADSARPKTSSFTVRAPNLVKPGTQSSVPNVLLSPDSKSKDLLSSDVNCSRTENKRCGLSSLDRKRDLQGMQQAMVTTKLDTTQTLVPTDKSSHSHNGELEDRQITPRQSGVNEVNQKNTLNSASNHHVSRNGTCGNTSSHRYDDLSQFRAIISEQQNASHSDANTATVITQASQKDASWMKDLASVVARATTTLKTKFRKNKGIGNCSEKEQSNISTRCQNSSVNNVNLDNSNSSVSDSPDMSDMNSLSIVDNQDVSSNRTSLNKAADRVCSTLDRSDTYDRSYVDSPSALSKKHSQKEFDRADNNNKSSQVIENESSKSCGEERSFEVNDPDINCNDTYVHVGDCLNNCLSASHKSAVFGNQCCEEVASEREQARACLVSSDSVTCLNANVGPHDCHQLPAVKGKCIEEDVGLPSLSETVEASAPSPSVPQEITNSCSEVETLPSVVGNPIVTKTEFLNNSAVETSDAKNSTTCCLDDLNDSDDSCEWLSDGVGEFTLDEDYGGENNEHTRDVDIFHSIGNCDKVGEQVELPASVAEFIEKYPRLVTIKLLRCSIPDSDLTGVGIQICCRPETACISDAYWCLGHAECNEEQVHFVKHLVDTEAGRFGNGKLDIHLCSFPKSASDVEVRSLFTGIDIQPCPFAHEINRGTESKSYELVNSSQNREMTIGTARDVNKMLTSDTLNNVLEIKQLQNDAQYVATEGDIRRVFINSDENEVTSKDNQSDIRIVQLANKEVMAQGCSDKDNNSNCVKIDTLESSADPIGCFPIAAHAISNTDEAVVNRSSSSTNGRESIASLLPSQSTIAESVKKSRNTNGNILQTQSNVLSQMPCTLSGSILTNSFSPVANWTKEVKACDDTFPDEERSILSKEILPSDCGGGDVFIYESPVCKDINSKKASSGDVSSGPEKYCSGAATDSPVNPENINSGLSLEQHHNLNASRSSGSFSEKDGHCAVALGTQKDSESTSSCGVRMFQKRIDSGASAVNQDNSVEINPWDSGVSRSESSTLTSRENSASEKDECSCSARGVPEGPGDSRGHAKSLKESVCEYSQCVHSCYNPSSFDMPSAACLMEGVDGQDTSPEKAPGSHGDNRKSTVRNNGVTRENGNEKSFRANPCCKCHGVAHGQPLDNNKNTRKCESHWSDPNSVEASCNLSDRILGSLKNQQIIGGKKGLNCGERTTSQNKEKYGDNQACQGRNRNSCRDWTDRNDEVISRKIGRTMNEIQEGQNDYRTHENVGRTRVDYSDVISGCSMERDCSSLVEKTGESFFVEVINIPQSCTKPSIVDFFADICVLPGDITLCLDPDAMQRMSAYVKFSNKNDMEKAISFSGNSITSCPVTVREVEMAFVREHSGCVSECRTRKDEKQSCSENVDNKSNSTRQKPTFEQSSGDVETRPVPENGDIRIVQLANEVEDDNMKLVRKSHATYNATDSHIDNAIRPSRAKIRKVSPSTKKPDKSFCVEITNIPQPCTKLRIMNFFTGICVVPGAITLCFDSVSGQQVSAFVEFFNKTDMRKALHYSGKTIASRVVSVHEVDKVSMLKQLSHVPVCRTDERERTQSGPLEGECSSVLFPEKCKADVDYHDVQKCSTRTSKDVRLLEVAREVKYGGNDSMDLPLIDIAVNTPVESSSGIGNSVMSEPEKLARFQSTSEDKDVRVITLKSDSYSTIPSAGECSHSPPTPATGEASVKRDSKVTGDKRSSAFFQNRKRRPDDCCEMSPTIPSDNSSPKAPLVCMSNNHVNLLLAPTTEDRCFRLTGVPPALTRKDLKRMLENVVEPDRIQLFNHDPHNYPGGVGYLCLKDQRSCISLLKSNRVRFGSLTKCTNREFSHAKDPMYVKSAREYQERGCVTWVSLSNLPPSITSAGVLTLFKDYSPVVSSLYLDCVNGDPRNGKSGNAFLKLGKECDVLHAVNFSKKFSICGFTVKVKRVSPTEVFQQLYSRACGVRTTPYSAKERAVLGRETFCVSLKARTQGLTERDALELLNGLTVAEDGVHVLRRTDGLLTGDCFVELVYQSQLRWAVLRSLLNTRIGHVSVKRMTRAEFLRRLGVSCLRHDWGFHYSRPTKFNTLDSIKEEGSGCKINALSLTASENDTTRERTLPCEKSPVKKCDIELNLRGRIEGIPTRLDLRSGSKVPSSAVDSNSLPLSKTPSKKRKSVSESKLSSSVVDSDSVPLSTTPAKKHKLCDEVRDGTVYVRSHMTTSNQSPNCVMQRSVLSNEMGRGHKRNEQDREASDTKYISSPVNVNSVSTIGDVTNSSEKKAAVKKARVTLKTKGNFGVSKRNQVLCNNASAEKGSLNENKERKLVVRSETLNLRAAGPVYVELWDLLPSVTRENIAHALSQFGVTSISSSDVIIEHIHGNDLNGCTGKGLLRLRDRQQFRNCENCLKKLKIAFSSIETEAAERIIATSSTRNLSLGPHQNAVGAYFRCSTVICVELKFYRPPIGETSIRSFLKGYHVADDMVHIQLNSSGYASECFIEFTDHQKAIYFRRWALHAPIAVLMRNNISSVNFVGSEEMLFRMGLLLYTPLLKQCASMEKTLRTYLDAKCLVHVSNVSNKLTCNQVKDLVSPFIPINELFRLRTSSMNSNEAVMAFAAPGLARQAICKLESNAVYGRKLKCSFLDKLDKWY